MSSIKNSTFMNVNKISNSIRNINKENSIADRNSEHKVNKIKSKILHQDLFWTFRILIMFFKLIGLTTFAHQIVVYKKRTSYIFQYSKLGFVYNVVLSSLMIASNYMSIPVRLNWNNKVKPNLIIGIAVLQTVLGTLVMCVILISYCINQKSLVRIANQLITIEHEINHLYDLYHPLQRERIFCTVIIVCILKICFLILLLFAQILTGHTDTISLVIDILPVFLVGWLLIQYFLLVMVIQTDFYDVNRAIQSFTTINAPDLRLQSLYQTRCIVINISTVHQLLQLRDIHCHLCEISEDVSNFYSLPVLFSFVFLFLSLVYNGHRFLWILLGTDDILKLNYSKIIYEIVWSIFRIYPIFLLTNRITRTLIEMKKTSNIVHDHLNCAIEKETKAELKKFSLQLLHRKIQFTANGYFTLDNTFLHSMKKTGNIVHDLLNCAIGKETKAELIGTVVTYLVIFVQFQNVSSHSSIRQQCNNTE
ncbi:Putative gustatory receptor 28a [Trachymyrmex cornetzi]|uniref:Gustatory receptor n=1 Tax=Trachymyrmex cornetzi TaxID=471704 RepID=A0A195DA39_9HYME|nr:Putative gustatory receptor 28a [Trachymyrmex cornetzi]